LIGLCWGCYCLAFAFPALTPRQAPEPLFDDFPAPVNEQFEARTKAVIASGDIHDISGSEAFRLAWVLHDKAWWGNVALWLASVLLAYRLWGCAALVSFVGFVLAAAPAAEEDTLRHGPGLGYWLWFGSVTLLFAGSLIGWCGLVPRDRRRSPAEVFRGWRGAAIGSWLAVGLAAPFVWWSAGYFHPPDVWRDAVIGVWLMLGVTLFALQRLEHDFSPRRLWRAATAGTWLVLAFTVFTLWCFWADVNPPRPPR
jgi:hypothetical protein